MELVRRAEAAGYRALVVTVDAPVSGIRNREQRAGFSLPPGVEAVNLRGMTRPFMYVGAPGEPFVLGGPLLAAASTWKDLDWLQSMTKLPVLIKGVMTAEDARRAAAMGINGIIVEPWRSRARLAAGDDRRLTRNRGSDRGACSIARRRRDTRGSELFKAIALGAKAALVRVRCFPILFGIPESARA